MREKGGGELRIGVSTLIKLQSSVWSQTVILLCVLNALLRGKSASPSLALAIDFVTFSAGSKGTLKVEVIVVKEERMC